MPIAWNPKRWWKFHKMSQDVEKKKKKIEPILLSITFNVYNVRILEHFDTWKPDIVFLIWFFDIFCTKIYIKQYIR